MTRNGGTFDRGTVFSIGTDGTGFTTLHTFTGSSYGDGATPSNQPILVGSTLYGLTSSGGDRNAGTLFSIGTDGAGYTILYHFDNQGGGGYSPYSGLLRDGPTFYGTTYGGGSSGRGAVFSIGTDGSGYTHLHDFTGGADDGQYPYASVILSGSTLYGTTYYGGPSNYGTVYSLSTDGSGFTLLHSFAGGADDGRTPYGGVIRDGGTLYGVTNYGGSSNYGVVFSIGTDGGGFTVMHSLAGGFTDGQYGVGDLTRDGSTLYGMAY